MIIGPFLTTRVFPSDVLQKSIDVGFYSKEIGDLTNCFNSSYTVLDISLDVNSWIDASEL